MPEEVQEESSGLDVSDEFERYPKLNEQLKKKGDVAIVKFVNDGKLVKPENMSDETLLKYKQMKIKPREAYVFTVENKDDEKMEFWMSAQAYSTRRELKNIAQESVGEGKKPTFEGGVMVKIERIAEASPTEPNYKFELYKEE
jgi:hypothetical protein